MFGFYSFSEAAFSGIADVIYTESVLDSVSLSDSSNNVLDAIESVSDILSFLDLCSANIQMDAFVSDSISISDSSFGILSAQPSASDLLVVFDNAANTAGMVASASDTMVLIDVGAGYGGWDPIPNPNPGWTPITTAPGSPWTPVPTVTATWTPIGNS